MYEKQKWPEIENYELHRFFVAFRDVRKLIVMANDKQSTLQDVDKK